MRWQQRREEYLSFVAHDLRTPLSAISLSARVLELRFPKDRTETRQATQMLNTLHRNVHHLEALVKKVIEESTKGACPLMVNLRSLACKSEVSLAWSSVDRGLTTFKELLKPLAIIA